MDILNSMIKSSSDNYSKSSAECLVIGLCLYVAITFHNNLIEAKIANKLITSVQSLNTLYLSLLKLVVSYFLACTFSQTLGATDFTYEVSSFGQSQEVKYFCHRC